MRTLLASYKGRAIILMIGESLMLIASLYAFSLINKEVTYPVGSMSTNICEGLFAVGVFQVSFYFHGLYDPKTFSYRIAPTRRLASSLIIGSILFGGIRLLFPSV